MSKKAPTGPRPIFIYALRDPFTREVRYIGKSIRPAERLCNHCNEQSRTHRTNWIRSVRALGGRPELMILARLPPDADWKWAERQWIANARAQGWPLTNSTSGGDGVPDLPAEIRARIARVWVGRKHGAEAKRKIGAATLGRRHTQEHKDKMRGLMAGRRFSPEWRAKISKGTSKLTDDQVRAIRQGLAENVSQYRLAEQFGVHQGTISNIKRGLFYAHVGAA